uniref:Leucine-rich repeat-containing N-terminal plant-type domain-containing protein n=1 Tax=Leersia perrieri TaxID=77586 RepID=A0A0D9WBS5_9ORYZ
MSMMMTQLHLLVLLLFVAAAAKDDDGQRQLQCHSDDEAALLAVDAALGSPYHFASWTPDTSCCDWYDVDCDADSGRVVSLTIFQDANLTGAIPDAIANLTHLRSLLLRHLPSLSGEIPSSLAALTSLTQLTISWTAVSGPIPDFIAELTALESLDLSFNSLTGAIPPSLAGLVNLSGINLSRNRLAGAIPSALFSNLDQQQADVYLWLSHNNLTGAIPPEFAAVSFAHVDVSRNQLTGDASPLFRRGRYVDVSRNGFVFNMSGVVFDEEVTYVDVSHNAIRGGVPAQVANLTSLQMFNVSYNKMCGQIPAGENMARFDAYCYQHNKCLCGAPLANACRH